MSAERVKFASSAPAPVEHPWPPASMEAAEKYRWAKIEDLKRLDRTLSRLEPGATRTRVLVSRKRCMERIEQVNAWIAHRQAAPLKLVKEAQLDNGAEKFASPDEEPPPGMKPMPNTDFLLYVRRQRELGHVGPVPRPLVRQ